MSQIQSQKTLSGSLSTDFPVDLSAELFREIIAIPTVSQPNMTTTLSKLTRIEEIKSPVTDQPGQWYNQDHGEWVIVLSGKAVVELSDNSYHELNSYNWLWLPTHCIHRVLRVEKPTLWLAIHFAD